MSRAKMLWAWAKPAGKWMGAAAVVVVPFLLSANSSDPRGFFTWHGVALELLGFLLVWHGLVESLKAFDAPGLRDRFWKWLTSIPLRTRVVSGVGMSAGSGAISVAGGRVGFRVQGSLEARLSAVEAALERLQGQHDALEKRVRDETAKLREMLEAEIAALRAAVREVSERLKQQAVGGFDDEIIGAAWFVAGLLLTTLTDEILYATAWLR